MRSFGATKTAVRNFLLSTTALLAISAGDASAHTVSIGYAFAGPGAVILWYGSYHADATFTEANVQLTGSNGYFALINFNLIQGTKPTGLVDGINNFYSNTAGTQLVGVAQQVASTDGSGGAFNPATQSVLNWQGARFTGLRPGIYTFTYNPLAVPTVEWHPINAVIESNSFTLTAFDILGIPGYKFYGNNVNQRAVGTALDNAINAGGYNQAIYNIAALPPAAMANALTQLSGEHATAAARASFQSLNAFMALTLDPWAAATRCSAQGPNADFGPAAYRQAIPQKEPNDRPCSSNEWSVWASAYGGTNTTRGDATEIGSHNTTINTGGMAVGADYRPIYGTVVGVAMSAGSNSWNLTDGLGGAKSDTFQAAAYASTRFDAMYLSAAVAYGNNRTTQDRTVTIFTSDAFTAKYNTNTIGTRIETGYRLNTAEVGVTPYAAIQAQYFRSPNYSEIVTYGAPDYALDYNARKATQTRFEAGSWFDYRLPIDAGATLSTRARAAWIYDMQSATQIAASFQTLPGSNFTVMGATPVTNAALVSAAAELKLRTGFSLTAKFDSEIGTRSTTLIGTGTLRYQW